MHFSNFDRNSQIILQMGYISLHSNTVWACHGKCLKCCGLIRLLYHCTGHSVLWSCWLHLHFCPRASAFIINFVISWALAGRDFLLESLTRALETAVCSEVLLWRWEEVQQNAEIRCWVQPTYLSLSPLHPPATPPFQAVMEQWREIQRVLASVPVISPVLVMDGEDRGGWDGMEWALGDLDSIEAVLIFVFPWVRLISSVVCSQSPFFPELLLTLRLRHLEVICAPRIGTHLLLNLK